MKTITTVKNAPQVGVEFKIKNYRYVITRNGTTYLLWQFHSDEIDSRLRLAESFTRIQSVEEFCIQSEVVSTSDYCVQRNVYEHGDRLKITVDGIVYRAIVVQVVSGGPRMILYENGWVKFLDNKDDVVEWLLRQHPNSRVVNVELI